MFSKYSLVLLKRLSFIIFAILLIFIFVEALWNEEKYSISFVTAGKITEQETYLDLPNNKVMSKIGS